MRVTAKKLLGWVLLESCCLIILLCTIYPRKPASMFGWMVLIILCIPLVVGLEFFGDVLFSDKNKKRSSNIRNYTYLFSVLVIAMILSVTIWDKVKPYLNVWH